MYDKIKYTPIQRNEFDVALELTEIYLESGIVLTVEEMQDVFSKFYAMAKGISDMGSRDLAKLVDNPEIAQILNGYQ